MTTDKAPERFADTVRNLILNSTLTDLDKIINGHDPETDTSINNLVWDRLNKMALEIEARALAHAAPSPDVLALVEYILQDDLHNRLTPRVVDIAYTAFMAGRAGKNPDDGGPCDWFTDTRPVVMKAIEKIRNDLVRITDTGEPT